MSGKRAKESSHGFSLRGFVRQSAHTQNWHFVPFVCVPFKTERTSPSPLELFTSPNSSPKTSKRRCENSRRSKYCPPEMRLIDCIEHKGSNLLLNHQSLTCCAGRGKTAVAIAFLPRPETRGQGLNFENKVKSRPPFSADQPHLGEAILRVTTVRHRYSDILGLLVGVTTTFKG